VHISVRETLSLSLLRDGGLRSLELKGAFELLVSDPALTKLRLNLRTPSSSSEFANDVQFKHHPNAAKFAPGGKERVIALKDPQRGLPVGKSLELLKWKLNTTNEAVVPLASESNVACSFAAAASVTSKERVLMAPSCDSP
jgi:hypothetical protein